MGATVDHLAEDYAVVVRRSFTDANGLHVEAGTAGVIRKIALDWTTFDLTIVWERDGAEEPMRFPFKAQDGPRSGHMREYFERGDSMPPAGSGAGRIVAFDAVRRGPRKPAPIPDLTDELVLGIDRHEEAFCRVWALAARTRFEEANRQIDAIARWKDWSGEQLRELADYLGRAAESHVDDKDPTVYNWVRDRAIDLWYSWGSCATSGGDGAYRAQFIREGEAHLQGLDRYRSGA